jgi:hypothetical protein
MKIQGLPYLLFPLLGGKGGESMLDIKSMKKEEKEMRYLTIILILVVGFTFSCAATVTKGRLVEKTQMDQLSLGETRVEKLTQIFGDPDKKETVKPGEEKYIYSYYRLIPHWWTKDEVQEQKLEVTVVDGVVAKYNLRGDAVAPITKE